MHCVVVRLVLLLHATSISFATVHEDVPIPAVRPQEDFYDGAGRGVKVEFRVDRDSVEVGTWFPLTLRIGPLDNPDQARAPELHQISEFRDGFEFRGKPDKRINDSQCEWTYTVRLRDATVRAIPALRYRYYLTGSETGLLAADFPTTLAPSLPLTVKQVEPPLSPVQPLEPAAWRITEEDGKALLDHPATPRFFRPGLWWLIPVVLALLWIVIGRWRYPDATRMARTRRNRAARLALDRLAKAEINEAGAIVRGYLQERFGLAGWRTTLDEIRAGLSTLSDERLTDLTRTWQSWEAQRFAPESDQPKTLSTSRFAELIRRIEEDQE